MRMTRSMIMTMRTMRARTTMITMMDVIIMRMIMMTVTMMMMMMMMMMTVTTVCKRFGKRKDFVSAFSTYDAIACLVYFLLQ